MTIRSLRECNFCSKAISEEDYIDAGAYGAHLHVDCFKVMSARDLCFVLELDDVELQSPEGHLLLKAWNVQ